MTDINNIDYSGIVFKRIEKQSWNGRTYHDYIFHAIGDTYNKLYEYFMEQSLAAIGDIKFGYEDGLVGVTLVFPFNMYTVTQNLPDGLKEYLQNVVESGICSNGKDME